MGKSLFYIGAPVLALAFARSAFARDNSSETLKT